MKTRINIALAAAALALFLGVPLAQAQSAPLCSPSTQIANVNDFVAFSASGGNGNYYWLATNGAPNTGSGQSFGTRYAFPGDFIVVVTSNGQNSLCVVRVGGGQVLGVSDVSTGPEDVALWAAIVGLIGSIIVYSVTAYKLGWRK